MNKYSILFFIFITILHSSPLSSIPVLTASDTLEIIEIQPIRKLSDQLLKDSFGLLPRGSLTAKIELSGGERQQPIITLADVSEGLKLYGIFPESEALINSILWKINSKITIRFQNHNYVLILKEVSEQSIKIGWLENESIHQISLVLPSAEAISEQHEANEPDNSESLLVLDTPPFPLSINPHEKKR